MFFSQCLLSLAVEIMPFSASFSTEVLFLKENVQCKHFREGYHVAFQVIKLFLLFFILLLIYASLAVTAHNNPTPGDLVKGEKLFIYCNIKAVVSQLDNICWNQAHLQSPSKKPVIISNDKHIVTSVILLRHVQRLTQFTFQETYKCSSFSKRA